MYITLAPIRLGTIMANRTTDLTPKQQHFCRAVVSGQTLSDSYREAYSAGNMTAASVHREASVLMSNPMVTQRVERLQRQKDRAVVATSVSDRERVLTKLRDMMDSAKTENVQLGAAIALGKTIALFSEVIVNKSETQTIDEIDREIAARIAELDAEAEITH